MSSIKTESDAARDAVPFRIRLTEKQIEYLNRLRRQEENIDWDYVIGGPKPMPIADPADAVPPMVPGAMERACAAITGCERNWLPESVGRAIESAYRDGFNAGSAAAERARIVTWLRETAEGLHGAAATTLANHYSLIADRIERGEHARATMPDTGADKS